MIFLVLIGTVSAVDIENGTEFIFDNSTMIMGDNFSVDTINVFDNELIFTNSTNFTFNAVANGSKVNITYLHLNITDKLYEVNFSTINTTADTQSNFTIGNFSGETSVSLYMGGVFDRNLNVNSTGYVNFTHNYESEMSCGLSLGSTATSVSYIGGGGNPWIYSSLEWVQTPEPTLISPEHIKQIESTGWMGRLFVRYFGWIVIIGVIVLLAISIKIKKKKRGGFRN